MALTREQTEKITLAGESFLEKRRPPVEFRNQLDFAYRIDGQSVFIYEIRPKWDKPSEILEIPVAKTTYVQTQNQWKVYWMRSNRKWYSYSPKPIVTSIRQFFDLVDKDPSGCFFG